MKYTRILKKGCKGEDVKYMQECLITIGYSVGASKADGIFGSSTEIAVKKYQANHKDVYGKALSVDGKIGEKTWYAIERDYKEKTEKIKYTRVLKLGMSGNDVKYMKDCLFKLKYYSENITQISNNTFGNDTEKAVKEYQKENKDTSGRALAVDGKIGEKTWYAVERDYEAGKVKPDVPSGLLDSYTHISADKRKKIEAEIKNIDKLRQEIILEILNYAYDKDVPGDVRALYIFGANLYDTNLKINYADEAEIDRASKKYPQYFNNGRKEWMKEQVKKNPKLPASDCSGMEVGYLREHKLVSNTFDTTANNLCSNKCSSAISKNSLKPGDWVGFNGHIGTYVGAGYVVEFAGGAYAAQLTKLDDRELYDFIKKKVVSGSKWIKFRHPKYF